MEATLRIIDGKGEYFLPAELERAQVERLLSGEWLRPEYQARLEITALKSGSQNAEQSRLPGHIFPTRVTREGGKRVVRLGSNKLEWEATFTLSETEENTGNASKPNPVEDKGERALENDDRN